jgi:hypothetical protein
MIDYTQMHGWLTVYKRTKSGIITCELNKHNTLTATFYTALRNKLVSRDSAGRGASVDGITWGSFNNVCGSYVDGTYAGTFAAGSNANLVISTPTSQQIKCCATFSFSTTKYINYFELGQGYAAPATGIVQLITSQYAYDNSLFIGSNSLVYNSGETMWINWIQQLGA